MCASLELIFESAEWRTLTLGFAVCGISSRTSGYLRAGKRYATSVSGQIAKKTGESVA